MNHKHTHKFWSLTQNGGAKSRRLYVQCEQLEWSKIMRTHLWNGTPIAMYEWPEPVPVFVYTTKTVFEDMLWSSSSNEIVSDRLRHIWEHEAPGAAQYLPVQLSGPGVEECPHKYWAVLWRRQIDCLAEESFDEDERGRFVQFCIINVARIPNDAVLGAVKDFLPQRIIRNDLKLKMKKAGIIGPRFSPIVQVHHSPQK